MPASMGVADPRVSDFDYSAVTHGVTTQPPVLPLDSAALDRASRGLHPARMTTHGCHLSLPIMRGGSIYAPCNLHDAFKGTLCATQKCLYKLLAWLPLPEGLCWQSFVHSRSDILLFHQQARRFTPGCFPLTCTRPSETALHQLAEGTLKSSTGWVHRAGLVALLPSLVDVVAVVSAGYLVKEGRSWKLCKQRRRGAISLRPLQEVWIATQLVRQTVEAMSWETAVGHQQNVKRLVRAILALIAELKLGGVPGTEAWQAIVSSAHTHYLYHHNQPLSGHSLSVRHSGWQCEEWSALLRVAVMQHVERNGTVDVLGGEQASAVEKERMVGRALQTMAKRSAAAALGRCPHKPEQQPLRKRVKFVEKLCRVFDKRCTSCGDELQLASGTSAADGCRIVCSGEVYKLSGGGHVLVSAVCYCDVCGSMRVWGLRLLPHDPVDSHQRRVLALLQEVGGTLVVEEEEGSELGDGDDALGTMVARWELFPIDDVLAGNADVVCKLPLFDKLSTTLADGGVYMILPAPFHRQ
eukprot:PLAT6948.1.p1 GENE.PLAT6948.1~~PLAT6948.1.p1  ORF type:complete len:524 (-),score=68.13 PLAT6948.1:804-2375(-)